MTNVFSQQLKLGKNPSIVEKSAVLELQSNNQGLLFPRLNDTLLINALTVPDGMVIFHVPTLQLLLRTGGSWKPLTVSSALNAFWSVSGNTGTSAANFLGTTDLRHLYFRTNNIQAMILDSAGNLGVGVSPLFTGGNREKLLVDAGNTTSYNVISGKGTIDNYLQLNIQNRSAGATASSDLVATADNGNETTNYVDLGINSSGFTNSTFPVLSGINNAYLYSTGSDFIMGNATVGKNLRFFTGGYATTNERLRIDGNGNIGIGISSPTAYLHLKDGAAAVNSSPLKFTTGILQTTAEAGAMEFDGSHLYITIGTMRYTLDQQAGVLTASNGIQRTGNNFTNTLFTGISGNQTVVAGIAAGNSLTLSSTTHATKGKILFGTSGYNEATNKLGLGNNIPTEALDVTGNLRFSGALMPNNNAGTAGYYLASGGAGAPPTWSLFDTTSITSFSAKVRSLFSAVAPLVYSNGVTSIPKATATTNGYLSSADWNTFNAKGGAYTTGNLTETGSNILTITGGSNAVLGSGTTVQVKQAGSSQSGFLTSANWNSFNNKQDPLTFGDVTGGDFTISGGSGAVIGSGLNLALSTLNSNVGSFGDPTSSAHFSVNGKGLITAAGSTPIAFPVTSVNALTGAVLIGLSNLNDAIITTPQVKQMLEYNGTNWVNKSPSFLSNAITSLNGITTSTQTFGIPQTNGTAPSWMSTDSTHTLNIPLASVTGVTAGLISNADWSSFSNKLSTVDTTNIAGFSQKVRSLFSATAPITYSNGLIGITQAKAAANGYLSSTDWNLFNNKVGSISLAGNSIDAAITFTVTSGAASGNRTLNTQVKNTILAGPSSGVDGVPTFRTLAAADLPVATASTVGGISVGTGLAVTAGGVLSATNTNSGTVSTVSASGTQGVTTSVTNATTNPAITIGLAAISPTSVAATGNVTGLNLSGINTGDQTITLTSDVTGTGTGSFATTIGTNRVTYAKIQQVTAARLIGNPTGSLANTSEITLGAGLSFVGSTLTYTPSTSGTVTSVGLSLPSIFTVSNSPVTSSGTLTGSLNTQPANVIFAGPVSGVAATPGFRSLAAADLPLATTTAVGGISVGTGLAVTAGVLSTTSAAPSGAAGGDLTGTYPNPLLATVNTNTGAFGSTTVVPQITVNGKGLITAVSPQTIAFPVTSVNTATGAVSLGIASLNDATITTPATNQVLQYNGTKWVNTTPSYISSAITSLNGLTAATQTFATPGTSGTAPAWSSTGSVHTLNIPLASATSVTAGLLSNTDWNTFNNKLSTVDTTNIINFATKVRSLFSVTAPVTYSNGLIGITQSTTTTNGYLSSTDWNSFNNKWSLTGNSGTTSGTNFIGTTGLQSFVMRTNNVQGLMLDSLGNVAIGASPTYTASPNREKLLVDAGTNAANDFINVVSAKGSTNNYLQINIQNRSAGSAASSDVVATNNTGTESVNFIDMGINSSANTSSGVLGGGNNAYLYSTGTDLAIGNMGTGVLKLFTGSSEDMRIDASGNVGIGTTSPIQKLDVTGTVKASVDLWVDGANTNSGTNTPGIRFGDVATGEAIASKRTTGGNQYGLDFYTNNLNRMVVLQGGNVGIGTTTPADKLSVAGNVSPTANNSYDLGTTLLRWRQIYTNNLITVSDARLKTNILKSNYGLKEILGMMPVTYNWKSAPTKDKQIGLIAQDVRKIIPEAVVGDESKEDIGINYIKLIPVLINAIKDQQQEIEDLKKQLLMLNQRN